MKFYGENDFIGVGGETEWAFPDSLHTYKYNLKKYGSEWEHKDKKITYRFNKSGFRCDKELEDIDWENSTVLFGCSYAFGTGVASDETISYYLEKLLDRPVINLGVMGSGNDLIINNMIALKKLGKPKEVIHMWTSTHRWAVYNSNSVNKIGPWNIPSSVTSDVAKMLLKDHTPTSADNFAKASYEFMPPSHYDVIVQQQNQITSLLWSNTELYNFASPEFYEPIKHLVTDITSLVNMGDLSRDGLHYGAKTNKACAEIIYNKIKRNQGLI